MRLTGSAEDQPVDEVWAYVTPEEAALLYEALRYYLEGNSADSGWHHHVGGPGGPELIIAIEGRPQ